MLTPTEEEIHEIHMKMKKKKQEAVQKSFPASSLPEVKKLGGQADKSASDYLKSYYGAN